MKLQKKIIVNKPEEILADEKFLSMAASLIDGNATITNLITKQIIYKKETGFNFRFLFSFLLVYML